MATRQARVEPTADVFTDLRGGGRALLVRRDHRDDPRPGSVTFSLWRGDTCAGTFWLAGDDVPALLASLTAGHAATTR